MQKFQSPYGVKVGCNAIRQGFFATFFSFNHLTELKLVATAEEFFGSLENGFNHLTELKLVATANAREIFVLNAIPRFFPLCEIIQAHRYHHSITFFTNSSQKRSDNATSQPVIIIQETVPLVKLFRYGLQNIKTYILFRYTLFTMILLKRCESPTDIKVQ